jgi:lipopolysaccharide transport protein LptA
VLNIKNIYNKNILFFIIKSAFFIIFCFIFNVKIVFASDFSNVNIKSEIIDIKRNSQKIIFKNNVIVESGDDSLLSDKMIVIYDDNKDIDKIKAIGNVKIFTKDFNASAKYGFYDPNKDLFILEENVIVNDGASIASGENFMYDLINKKGIFVGHKNESLINTQTPKKRVKIIINNE